MVLVLLCYTLLAWRWPRSDVHNIILLAPVQKRPSSIQLSYHLPISVRWPVLPGSLSLSVIDNVTMLQELRPLQQETLLQVRGAGARAGAGARGSQ